MINEKGQFVKGNKPWNTGKKRPPFSEKCRKKMSESHRGKKLTKEHAENIKNSKLGKKRKPFSKEWKKNMGGAHKGLFSGEKHPLFGKKGPLSSNWKGGVTQKHELIRSSLEYKLWRTAVFERDNYTCIWCGQVGGTLQADHIQLFSTHPDLRFAIDNGRTLCKSCHIKRHKKNQDE